MMNSGSPMTRVSRPNVAFSLKASKVNSSALSPIMIITST